MTLRRLLDRCVLAYVQEHIGAPPPHPPIDVSEIFATALKNTQDLHNLSPEAVKEAAAASAESYRKWREACPERIGREPSEDESVEFIHQALRAICSGAVYSGAVGWR